MGAPVKYSPHWWLQRRRRLDAEERAEADARSLGHVESAATMDLKRAVEILNERSHRGIAEWRVDEWDAFAGATGPDRHMDWLDEFETIAIAEKYEREPADA